MSTKHRASFRSLFASTESAGLPPVVEDGAVSPIISEDVTELPETPVEGVTVTEVPEEPVAVAEAPAEVPTVAEEPPVVAEAPVEGDVVGTTEEEPDFSPLITDVSAELPKGEVIDVSSEGLKGAVLGFLAGSVGWGITGAVLSTEISKKKKEIEQMAAAIQKVARDNGKQAVKDGKLTAASYKENVDVSIGSILSGVIFGTLFFSAYGAIKGSELEDLQKQLKAKMNELDELLQKASKEASTENLEDVPVTVEATEGEGMADDLDVESELTPELINEEVADTNLAEEEVDAVAAEVETEVAETHEIAEVNEEFFTEAQAATEEGNYEGVTATIEASNEALAILTGSNKYDIRSVSFENYSNERVRATMIRVSMEAVEERTGNILQRAWEAIKKMIASGVNFIMDTIGRFQNQEKRLEKLKGELQNIKGNQRLVVKASRLVARLTLGSEYLGTKGLTGTMEGLVKGADVMENRIKRLNEFYKSITTANFDRSYAGFAQALGINPAASANAANTSKSDVANIVGGFTMTNSFVDEQTAPGARGLDYKYEFSHSLPTAGKEELALPSAPEMYQVVSSVLTSYGSLKKKIDSIKANYKITDGVMSGAYKATVASAVENDSNDLRAHRVSMLMGVQGIYNRAFMRPVMDLLKIAVFQLQTTAMLATAVTRTHTGENVDEKEGAVPALESFTGTVSDATVNKLRGESPEDDTTLVSESGKKTDEDLTPATDDGLNETKPESTVTPKKMTSDELEDTNAELVVDDLEGISAALEELEEREHALADTNETIDILEDAQGEGGLDSAGAALLNLSAESVNRLMGWRDRPQVTASVESYQSVSGRRMANAASMENFKERADAIAGKLKQGLKVIWDWIKSMASRFYEMVVSADKRADAIIAKLRATEKAPEGEITNAQTLKMISSRQGAMDAASMIRAMDRSKALLDVSAKLGDDLLGRVQASADNLDARVNFGAECEKIARAAFVSAGAYFNPHNSPTGELFGLLGGQQLAITLDAKTGLTKVVLEADDAVKTVGAVKYFAVPEALKVAEATKALLASARGSKVATEKAMAQMDRFMKNNPKVDEARDENGGVFRQWTTEVQANSRGVTQLIVQSFKGVKYSVDAGLRLASYSTGAAPKEEAPAATPATA